MSVSSHKHIRLTGQTIDEEDVSNHEEGQFDYAKVLCKRDYLQMICTYLRIFDIFGTVVLLSTFHNDEMHHKASLKTLILCLEHDFGNILRIFRINLSSNAFNNNNNNSINDSVCFKISQFYCDWDYLMRRAMYALIHTYTLDTCPKTNLFFGPLMQLNKCACVRYWFNTVLSIMNGTHKAMIRIPNIQQIKCIYFDSGRELVFMFHQKQLYSRWHVNMIIAASNLKNLNELRNYYEYILKLENKSNMDSNNNHTFWKELCTLTTKYSVYVKNYNHHSYFKNIQYLNILYECMIDSNIFNQHCKESINSWVSNLFHHITSNSGNDDILIKRIQLLHQCMTDSDHDLHPYGLQCKKLIKNFSRIVRMHKCDPNVEISNEMMRKLFTFAMHE